MALAAAAAVFVGGCRNDTNTLIGLGTDPLPALCAATSSVVNSPQEPSLTGLDRRNWPVVLVEVARGQVETNANYLGNLHLAAGIARDSGCYPSYATALESTSTPNSLVAEAALQPAWVPAMLVVAPIRRFSGSTPFDARYPESDFQLLPSASESQHLTLWRWVEKTPNTTE